MKMIDKEDYLKECIRNRFAIDKRVWYIKIFTIPELNDEDHSDMDHYDLCIKHDGLYVVVKENDTTELLKIRDHKRGEALFHPRDEIKVDKNVMSNISEDITFVGRLIKNAVIVPKHLESKMPYFTNRAESRDIEGEIAKRVRNPDEKQEADSITVQDMIDMQDNMNFLEVLGFIVNVAATPKSITSAPGIGKYVEGLIKEAGDEFNDPVFRTELEKKAQAYDKEYLKDDPVAQNLFARKAQTGRTKLYSVYGSGLDFINDSNNDTFVADPISKGINPDPEVLRKYMNDLRYASFSRGDNTALGGSIYKELQRSLNSLKITPTTCKTTEGLKKILTKEEAQYSLGRFIKQGTTWKALTSADEIKSLIGKEVEMRSPMYCKESGDAICYACVSARYKVLANGVSNMAAEISDVLLNMFLKLMHGVQKDMVTLQKSDLIN